MLIILPNSLLLGSFLSSNEQHTHKHFSAAMLLSVPWNLMKTTQNIEKPYLNRLLCSYLAKCLCNLVERLVKIDVSFFLCQFNQKVLFLCIKII